MQRKSLPLAALCALFILAFTQSTYSQTNKETIYAFIDCRGCSESFIQTEIEFVNFVRDQEDADVHIFIVNQRTGSGGVEYTIEFIGQKNFEGDDETMKIISPESDTQEERRNKLVSHIKLGLVGYLFNTDIINQLDLNFDNSVTIEPTQAPENDPWNKWLFEIGGSTNFSGEESQNRININTYVSADRITEEWKFESGYRYNTNRRTVFGEDSVTVVDEMSGDSVRVEVDTKDLFINESQFFFTQLVKSFGDHWSAGFWTTARTSTQDNIDLRLSFAPAVEFSLFPYDEFTRRQILVRYGFTIASLDYTETTIFGKDEELLLQHEFRIDSEFTQPWGGVEGSIRTEAYTHDLSKNNIRFDARIDMRIFRGLNVFFSGRYSFINDQLSLPAGGSTEEEVLLNLRNQATSYSFGGSVGIEFTFGSIYNNVINPRL
ncbi:MAG: hypothetical protein ED557_12230 [Balneola sp.]|nr:MAG: hypothetical protein ED557_12230 [Balneola sp.]